MFSFLCCLQNTFQLLFKHFPCYTESQPHKTLRLSAQSMLYCLQMEVKKVFCYTTWRVTVYSYLLLWCARGRNRCEGVAHFCVYSHPQTSASTRTHKTNLTEEKLREDYVAYFVCWHTLLNRFWRTDLRAYQFDRGNLSYGTPL